MLKNDNNRFDYKNQIIIENLKILAKHGLYEPEQRSKQTFILNIILNLDFEKAAELDDVNYTIDYDEFCGFIETIVKNKNQMLLETVAKLIAEKSLLKYEILQSIQVEICKQQTIFLKNNADIDYVKIRLEREWHTAFLGLGSNMGNKLENIQTAIKILEKTDGIFKTETSTITNTQAYGEKMADFLNCVVRLKTFLEPFKLLKICKKIEKTLKREHSKVWGPRTIDVDILFFDDLVLSTETLTIPHPDLQNRNFVLNPMVELNPNFVHPVFLKTMNALKRELDLKNKA